MVKNKHYYTLNRKVKNIVWYNCTYENGICYIGSAIVPELINTFETDDYYREILEKVFYVCGVPDSLTIREQISYFYLLVPEVIQAQNPKTLLV